MSEKNQGNSEDNYYNSPEFENRFEKQEKETNLKKLTFLKHPLESNITQVDKNLFSLSQVLKGVIAEIDSVNVTKNSTEKDLGDQSKKMQNIIETLLLSADSGVETLHLINVVLFRK